jgi:hypothetical protein
MTSRRLWHPLRVVVTAAALAAVAVLASGCIIVPDRPYHVHPIYYGYR